MVKNSRFAVLVALFVMLHAGVAMAQDWPEFLGEGGVARSDDKIPTTWNDSQIMDKPNEFACSTGVKLGGKGL